tara:strand:+ start:14280 stop:14516 length:237 start_codon:yes stop_codon:yes gene_type:complete
MDFVSPKVIIAGAVVATLSAGVNTTMFTHVNNTVQENKLNVAVNAEKVREIKTDQKVLVEQSQEIYNWVLKQQGKQER